MPEKLKGSIHLARVAGIDLYLHWTWFAVALFEIQSRRGLYSSIVWNILEYLALFLIVLMHEFGHALACRQVGGISNRIMLWPLGGVAYVNPPQRPGATLWSLAAGPLVNVALLPVFWAALNFASLHGWAYTSPDLYHFIRAVYLIDIMLLVFNLLPVYPLDGGQILRSLLWFLVGRGRSLMLATIIGFVGVAAFLALAVYVHSVWYGAMAVFMLMSCWGGLANARAILRLARLPRHPGFACPSCREAPPIGPIWVCKQCSNRFDPFETGATCPSCSARSEMTQCPECGQSAPFAHWSASPAVRPEPAVESLPGTR
ncbi:MAG TPA: site-2 protease family protein [Terracidiphilus sp.]|jgi:Zn-dependent protease|nr:site-2 protease family protein [Terracidiphilus sp.]